MVQVNVAHPFSRPSLLGALAWSWQATPPALAFVCIVGLWLMPASPFQVTLVGGCPGLIQTCPPVPLSRPNSISSFVYLQLQWPGQWKSSRSCSSPVMYFFSSLFSHIFPFWTMCQVLRRMNVQPTMIGHCSFSAWMAYSDKYQELQIPSRFLTNVSGTQTLVKSFAAYVTALSGDRITSETSGTQISTAIYDNDIRNSSLPWLIKCLCHGYHFIKNIYLFENRKGKDKQK